MFKFPLNSYVYINVYWSIDYFATVVLQSAPVSFPCSRVSVLHFSAAATHYQAQIEGVNKCEGAEG